MRLSRMLGIGFACGYLACGCGDDGSSYAEDEAAFCDAYGAGDYAPDLMVPRTQPGT